MTDATDRFGPYLILERLGEGGMGVVDLALDTRLDRKVALKRIRTQEVLGDLAVDQRARARFFEEIRSAGRLSHPSIVRILEVGEIDGQPYFSMELVLGRALDRVIEEEELGPAAAARLVLELARALDHAHAAGVIHRDLKPSNVLVDEGYKPRLVDFGLAKRTEDDSGLTRTGCLVGTLQYMAPEQADATLGPIGPATDVYGLGAILFECLTGEPPNSGQSKVEIVFDILKGPAPSPRSRNPHVPAALDAICRKALAKDPRARFRDMTAFAARLDAYLALRIPAGARGRLRLPVASLPWKIALVFAVLAIASIVGLVLGRAGRAPESSYEIGVAELRRDLETAVESWKADDGTVDQRVAAAYRAWALAAELRALDLERGDDRFFVERAREIWRRSREELAAKMFEGVNDSGEIPLRTWQDFFVRGLAGPAETQRELPTIRRFRLGQDGTVQWVPILE